MNNEANHPGSEAWSVAAAALAASRSRCRR